MLDMIEVRNLDGSDCLVLVKSLAEHPFDLFFTDWVLTRPW